MSFTLWMSDFSETSQWTVREDGAQTRRFDELPDEQDAPEALTKEKIFRWLQRVNALVRNGTIRVNCRARGKRNEFCLADPFGNGLFPGSGCRAGNLLGFYRDEEGAVELRSRLDAPEKPYFFLQMLLAAQTWRLHDRDVAAALDCPLSELLPVFFFQSCLREVIPLGCYRTYVRFERNDGRLRGSIDVARHLRENLGLKNGRICYSYRELSADNPTNHLILRAAEAIRKRFPDLAELFLQQPETAEFLAQLRSLAPGWRDVSDRTVLGRTLQAMDHPLFPGYETLRIASRMLLQYEAASWSSRQEDFEARGILYYAPDLWEQYLERQYRRAGNAAVTLEAQLPVRAYWSEGRPRDTWYPDLVFLRQGRRCFFADAKYKPGWKTAHEGGLSSEGLAADYNKCLRDMVSLRLQSCGVIFPTQAPLTACAAHRISEFNEDLFYTFPVFVPSIGEKPFSTWSREMTEHTQAMLAQVAAIAQTVPVPHRHGY